MIKIVSFVIIVVVMLTACGNRSTSSSVNPRDTVTVPEGVTGEDSIAYIENKVLHSPISAKDLLGLAEVHAVQERLYSYDSTTVSPRDAEVLRLANRLMRMYNVVDENGDANDKLQWVVAVNTAIDAFHKAVPSVPSDSALYEVEEVLNKFSSQSQNEMNFQCYVHATIIYYQTIEDYRKWFKEVPSDLRPLMEGEYAAWHDLHEARYNFWADVSYRQEWYSMKPMELAAHYIAMLQNRRAEMDIERGIIIGNKLYQQQSRTMTPSQWEQWIAENSVPEDLDELYKIGDKDLIPSDSLVADRVKILKSSFYQWVAARKAVAEALPESQGRSYDNLSADINNRMIGKLPPLIPYLDE